MEVWTTELKGALENGFCEPDLDLNRYNPSELWAANVVWILDSSGADLEG